MSEPKSCWYKVSSEWKGGKLHAWATDHVEYPDCCGPIPVGIVEDEVTNKLLSVSIRNISFATTPN